MLTPSSAGYPVPEYQWLKGGSLLTEEYSAQHFYKIPHVGRDDAGTYRCRARNPAGSILSPAVHLAVACEY